MHTKKDVIIYIPHDTQKIDSIDVNISRYGHALYTIKLTKNDGTVGMVLKMIHVVIDKLLKEYNEQIDIKFVKREVKNEI